VILVFIWSKYKKTSLYQSFHHTLDHLWLDWTISEIFSVEVLRFITNSVSPVSNNRYSNFFVIRLFLDFLTVNCCFKAIWHSIVGLIWANISNVQSWSKRINIEERVFSMIDLGHWSSVEWLVSLIANSWQVHPGSLLLDFNTLKPNNKIKYFKLTRRRGTHLHRISPFIQLGRLLLRVFCDCLFQNQSNLML